MHSAKDGRHLIVIEDDAQRVLDLSSPTGYASCSGQLFWSSDGRSLVTQTVHGVRSIELETGDSCQISSNYEKDDLIVLGFASDQSFAVAGGYDPGITRGLFRDTQVTLYGGRCAAGRSWIVKGRVYQGDTSSSTGRIALQRRLDPLLFLNTRTGEQTEFRTRHLAHFGDEGRVLCLSTNQGKHEVSCFLDAPNAVRRSTFGPMAMVVTSIAVRAPRLAVLESNYSYNPFTEVERSSPKRWIIWDVRSQDRIAALNALIQTGRPVFWATNMAYSSSLSPYGRQFMVAGDDRLLVYAVLSAR